VLCRGWRGSEHDQLALHSIGPPALSVTRDELHVLISDLLLAHNMARLEVCQCP